MSEAKFDTLKNLAGDKSVPVPTVVAGSAKAWVNFNGVGVVAIHDSFNVIGVTDNGVGDYTVNFDVPMPDANYIILPNAEEQGPTAIIAANPSVGGIYSTAAVQIVTTRQTTAASARVDSSKVLVAVFSN